MGSCLWNAWEKNLLFSPSGKLLYNLIMVNLLCTFLLFNYRIAENVLTCLNQKKILYFIIGSCFMLLSVLIDGRLLIGSKCIGHGAVFSKVRRTSDGWFKRISRHIEESSRIETEFIEMQRDMFMLHLFIIILICKYLVILWNTKIKQDSETSLIRTLKATL